MRVGCPACGTEYEAPGQVAGRNLRCAACGEVFRAGGAAPKPEPPPTESPAAVSPEDSRAADDVRAVAPDRAESLDASPVSAPLSAAPRIAWGASLALLAVGGIALHAFRAEIAEAWPPMLRLYRALGLL